MRLVSALILLVLAVSVASKASHARRALGSVDCNKYANRYRFDCIPRTCRWEVNGFCALFCQHNRDICQPKPNGPNGREDADRPREPETLGPNCDWPENFYRRQCLPATCQWPKFQDEPLCKTYCKDHICYKW